MNEKKDILTKTWVVAVLASICCMLWGSAFSCVKIGYSLMNITTNDSGSQLVFGGIRFFVAGLMALAMGSTAERKILLPTKTSIPKIMIISLFQTLTSIQEQTLTFVPKLIAILIGIMVMGTWILNEIVAFMNTLWGSFSQYIS